MNEFKQMVQSLHENDIRVVMDVVYNHTGATADSDFNKIVPGYYYRKMKMDLFRMVQDVEMKQHLNV